MVFVEAFQLIVPDTASHRGDIVHIRLIDHCRHDSVGITGLKLVAAVLFPKGFEIIFGHRMLLGRRVHDRNPPIGDWRLRVANEPKMAAIFEAARNKIRSAGRPVVFPEFGYIGPGLKARSPAISRQESYRSSHP
jgi:hypothetical protein